MIYLSKEDIKKVFSMREAIDADKEALGLYSQGKTNIPLRTNIDIPEYNGQSLYMPGYVGGEQPALGMKIVSVYPDNINKKLPSVPATMVVLDPETGIVNAILDGTYLTQLRTGAVQGLATELLSNKDSKTALLIGTGGQGMSQLEAMLTVRSLEKVYIFDLDKTRSEEFCNQAAENFGEIFNTKFESIADVNDVLPIVDIITSVTTSRRATFDGSLVKDGVHINGVGAYTPEMCEIPETALKRASNIYFDTMNGVLAEAGDIIQPLDKGIISKNDISGELGQLINGNIQGRTSESDITVFKTVGTAALDAIVADRIVRLVNK
ncbi:ornithine cyclodeaminase family protein [Companilactobacillus nuruki]|uniref:Delta(1)-pyrroline-2-carboxylate reductase n=1 Tax=Companilactobacillus nuruki TaxID=1993540 RepID=A0A2N7AXL5_9LACO|nr:ornithine cyclodeaminase family protein [Companilactobacillus nuruki]PMD73838.1 ornithine cyclodeaminase family protein [Companilactobacillus nuruki]